MGQIFDDSSGIHRGGRATITAAYLAAPAAPTLTHGGGNRAYYVPARDTIHLPVRAAFGSGPHYYATAFHELAHSTGHATRLNRPGITDKARSSAAGDYSREELVAEIGAAMLAAQAGIEETVFDNSASYVASWLHRLEDDKKLVITAAREAMAAADRVLEPGREAQPEPGSSSPSTGCHGSHPPAEQPHPRQGPSRFRPSACTVAPRGQHAETLRPPTRPAPRAPLAAGTALPGHQESHITDTRTTFITCRRQRCHRQSADDPAEGWPHK